MTRENEERLQHSCPFCRQVVSTSEENAEAEVMKRIEANDPVVMCQMSKILYAEANYSVVLEYFTKAAELGDEEAHYNLASIYGKGKVLRRTRKRKYSILKRLQLVVIPGEAHA